MLTNKKFVFVFEAHLKNHMKNHMKNLHIKCTTCPCTCTNQGLSGMLLYDMPRNVCIIQVCIPLVWKVVVWKKVMVNILNVAKGRLDGEGGGDRMWSIFYALFKISYFKIIVKYDMRCLVGKELGVSEFFPTHSQPSQLSQLRREVLNYCQYVFTSDFFTFCIFLLTWSVCLLF